MTKGQEKILSAVGDRNGHYPDSGDGGDGGVRDHSRSHPTAHFKDV